LPKVAIVTKINKEINNNNNNKRKCKCDRTQSTSFNSYLIYCSNFKLNFASLKKGVGVMDGLSCSRPYHDDQFWGE
jgi:hypothetical protein